MIFVLNKHSIDSFQEITCQFVWYFNEMWVKAQYLFYLISLL